MTRAYTNPGRPDGHVPLSGSSDRGELDLFDVIALAWAERGFILLVFAVIFALGAAASLTVIKPTYTAQSRLLVLLEGDPTPTAAGAGGAFMLPQIMQSESALLSSDTVQRIALETIGTQAVIDEADTPSAQEAALKVLSRGFGVTLEPNSSALIARFESNDRNRSAVILNAIVDAYLAYRQQILIQSGVESLAARRLAADRVVAETQAELDRFLTANALANFASDKLAAEASVTTLQASLRTARADREAAQAGADALRARLVDIPENIALYIENGASNRLLDRRVERQQLLARYQPEAPPVVAIDREIEALEALISAGGTAGLGTVRTGVNPVRQALETELSTRVANAMAEADRVTALQQQVSTAQAEVARLRALEPAYTRLSHNVEAASAAAAEIAGQEAVAAARTTLGPGAADAVRVFDPASPPLEGRSMKKLAIVASFVLAAGIAIFLGLLRGYWNAYVGARQQRSAPHLVHSTPQASAPVAAASMAPVPPVDPFQAAGIDDLPILARVADRRV